jgi:hypothetical protein
MSSAETDRKDSRERLAIIEKALEVDRRARDRIRDRADEKAPEREA